MMMRRQPSKAQPDQGRLLQRGRPFLLPQQEKRPCPQVAEEEMIGRTSAVNRQVKGKKSSQLGQPRRFHQQEKP